MCFFPKVNYRYSVASPSKRKNMVPEFECGQCPECLRKKANQWVLRSTAEASLHAQNCMICLTYDSNIYDEHGKKVGERVSPLDLSVRDIQLFMKRLRKRYGKDIKYVCAGEYGSRTGRAHYHVLLFGVTFEDCVFYKKSKRGNTIYTSNILTRLWGHGICTVDALNVNAATAAYCTKYTIKDKGVRGLFLVSHGVGLSKLLADFNGKNYIVEGREHPIPRMVWQRVIMSRYPSIKMDYRYRGSAYSFEVRKENRRLRRRFRQQRNFDAQYRNYLAYWSKKAFELEKKRPSVIQRVLALPDEKYTGYKHAYFRCVEKRKRGFLEPPPRVESLSGWARKMYDLFGPWFNHLPFSPCHKTANDANPLISQHFERQGNGRTLFFDRNVEKNPFDLGTFNKKIIGYQQSIDDFVEI